jgi:UDP-3-O-[3-hydroxymyristoyl] glucosamine N-acyltransferase
MININEILCCLSKLNIKYLYNGNDQISINSFSSLNNLKDFSISWIKNKSNFKQNSFFGFKNVILVIKSDIEIDNIDNEHIGFIICDNPKEVFFEILKEFFKKQEYNTFISSYSVIETKDIGKDVYIGHHCYISKDVKIGDNVIIKNNVSIEGKVEIGNNTIINSGVVMGTDGFGYYQDTDGTNKKVPHYGGIIIGAYVEIGANTCIDRGTLDDTIIENNVKIDNLCHIAHNVIIKENSMVIALSMLGGSSILEKNSYIAPGAMVKNQLTVGENSLVGMGAVVVNNVESNKVVAGVPAKVMREK